MNDTKLESAEKTPVIEIRDLFFSYDGQPVLDDVNLTVQQGEFIAMIGPNGGGKTTLVKLTLGLLKPDRGSIRVLGKSARKASDQIGYVPQGTDANRDFPITVLDVVLMGKLNRKRRFGGMRAHREEAEHALKQMEMADYAGRKIGDLSGGQRQRVFIARALISQPKILLLDEPITGVDAKGQSDFLSMLTELNRDLTILLVSHNLLAISDYVTSAACVNKRLHFHQRVERGGGLLQAMQACTVDEHCPVDLVNKEPHCQVHDHGALQHD